MTQSLILTPAELLGQSNQHIHYYNDRVGINKHMLKAYESLVDTAKKDGIEIAIASGFRSFDRQRLIWNNKFSGKTAIKGQQNNTLNIVELTPTELMHSILLYSALPGASRHHWGCDIDVYSPNLLAEDYQLQLEPWEYQPSGPLAKLSLWLTKNAHKFGFYLPYESYQGGVAAEPWHLSYAPLASQYQQILTVDLLMNTFSSLSKELALFGQDIVLDNLAMIMTRYVNNINATPDNCYNRFL